MNLNPTVADVARGLCERFPGVPYIALGQTVLWDEPMKAVWRAVLDETGCGAARLIAGVHDTDYFAKTTALIHSDAPYVSLAHDDFVTRGLWSAAGELSALLGSEDVPTIADYEAAGLPIGRMAAQSQHGAQAFYSAATEAWGWRGIVGTSPRQPIAGDVALDAFLPALRDLLDWGFRLSAEALAPERRAAAGRIRDILSEWIAEAISVGATQLRDLYRALLPRLYTLLLGEAPRNFDTTASSELFRFNSDTCERPLFRLVELFVRPATRRACVDAYDEAVAGGGMYTLSEFGDGALPFDLAVPGVGRGTVRLVGTDLRVNLPAPHAVATTGDRIECVADLARVVSRELGPDTALVGKAVTLVSMLASEFLILFHETASAYTDRTAAMNDRIRRAGMTLDVMPIVRIQYPTWDALGALGEDPVLELPAHLAAAFGQRRISPVAFATRWRGVAHEQNQLVSGAAAVRSPRQLMDALQAAGDSSRCWRCDRETYEHVQAALSRRAEALDGLRRIAAEMRSERAALRRRIDTLQRSMGDHFRRRVLPAETALAQCADERERQRLSRAVSSAHAARTRRYVEPLARAQAQVRQLGFALRACKAELRRAERSRPTALLRDVAEQLTRAAETARLAQLRAALLTSRGLPHTNARPTAWWLPVLDPTGRWFRAIAEGTSARLESL